MKPKLRRIAPMLACTTLAACFALPASLSFARHRQLKGGTRRYACEAFVPDAPVRVAKAGDTLWSLTGDNTGKPWIWPQIWTLNPELTNPHVLAVGQAVHFVARASVPAPQVASQMPMRIPSEADTDSDEDADDVLADALAEALPVAAPVSAPASAAGNVATPFVPPSSPPPPRCLPVAFLAASELRPWGTVERSTHAGLLSGAGDELTIGWPRGSSVPPGPWALVQVLAHGRSPHGQLATCTGIATPVDGSGGRLGVVIAAREEIEMGQRVLPLSALSAPAPAALAPHVQAFGPRACGRVLAFEEASLTGSPMHLVLFDRGRADGLRVGDVLTGPAQDMDHRVDVKLTVLRVGEHSATLKPLHAPQELSRGQTLCGIGGAPAADRQTP